MQAPFLFFFGVTSRIHCTRKIWQNHVFDFFCLFEQANARPTATKSKSTSRQGNNETRQERGRQEDREKKQSNSNKTITITTLTQHAQRIMAHTSPHLITIHTCSPHNRFAAGRQNKRSLATCCSQETTPITQHTTRRLVCRLSMHFLASVWLDERSGIEVRARGGMHGEASSLRSRVVSPKVPTRTLASLKHMPPICVLHNNLAPKQRRNMFRGTVAIPTHSQVLEQCHRLAFC